MITLDDGYRLDADASQTAVQSHLPSRSVTTDGTELVGDTAVIGAGIVGLAVAWHLRHSRRVIVVEKEAAPALHQTGRNSGVIHSGIYYAPDSSKARLCLDGRERLERFCRDHTIPIRASGKLIGATNQAEVASLGRLAQRGESHGIRGLELLDTESVKRLEPAVNVLSALLVPTTGIVDFRAVTLAMARDVEMAGGLIFNSFQVTAVESQGSRVALIAEDGRKVTAESAVNCGGLYADRIARLAGASTSVRIIPFKGLYYSVVYNDLVKRPVYPVPDPAFPFLGVHLTPSLSGGLIAGPNAVLAMGREAYTRHDRDLRETLALAGYSGFWRLAKRYWRTGLREIRNTMSRRAFANSIRTMIPAFREEWLEPAGSGIRAQAVDRRGRLVDDFSFSRSGSFVHVVNAPSPAATASIAIARQIVDMMDGPSGLASVPN
jgi:L-2-hydroxyglutarate oxidase LhgO